MISIHEAVREAVTGSCNLGSWSGLQLADAEQEFLINEIVRILHPIFEEAVVEVSRIRRETLQIMSEGGTSETLSMLISAVQTLMLNRLRLGQHTMKETYFLNRHDTKNLTLEILNNQPSGWTLKLTEDA